MFSIGTSCVLQKDNGMSMNCKESFIKEGMPIFSMKDNGDMLRKKTVLIAVFLNTIMGPIIQGFGFY